MKIAVIGGVKSTTVLIDKLNQHNFKEVKIWSYKPKNLSSVSGWEDLKICAKKYDFECIYFTKVGYCEETLEEYQPDYIFVVGLSQIIPKSIIQIAKYNCIGFHPTALPKGRGRAPLAWLILEEENGAATFFLLEPGIDSGSIVEQVEFEVTNKDNAESVYNKMLEAEKNALDSLLPKIKKFSIQSFRQDDQSATWFGKRNPEDGLIDWNKDVNEIDKLIRASTNPHPGAFTFHDQHIIRIWESEKSSASIKGVVGRIIDLDNSSLSFLVQTGNGLIKVKKWSSSEWTPKVGNSLGYSSQIEIHKIYKENAALHSRLKIIEAKLIYLEKLIKPN